MGGGVWRIAKWSAAYAPVLLVPANSPACRSHDPTGFQPVAYG
jgi:hypothetical protein